MQWDQQTENIFNGWFRAPQKVWENWWDVLAGSTQNGYAHKTATNGQSDFPMFDLWSAAINQWQAMMDQGIQAVSPEMSESARVAMAQFMTGQEHAQQLYKMSTAAWQAIMANTASPAEWQPALEQYIAQLRSQMADAGDVNKFMKNSTQLWQQYGQEMQKSGQPWLNMWMQFPQQMGTMTGSRDKANPLIEMMNLAWDSYNQTLGRMTNMPSLGLMREFNETINRSFVSWQENQRISLEYQVLLGDAMLSAFEALMQKLLEKAKAGETIDTQNELLTLWVAVADEVFLQLFHSERYATLQSQYVNSSMALRQQQRALTEILLRMNDLPTRSDLDEAHKNIFELRKEVKALKKTVHDLANQVMAPTVTADTSIPHESAQTSTAGKSAARKSAKRTTTKPSTVKPATTKPATTKPTTTKPATMKTSKTTDKGA
jgi:class III poly(R)-hydroxyalkanoic acid synthase PhaE subunit